MQGRWRGRDVSVTWEDGELSGDAELVASLRQLDGSGEVIGTLESEASGKLVLGPSELLVEGKLPGRQARFLRSANWVGDITAVSGDLDGIDPANYIE